MTPQEAFETLRTKLLAKLPNTQAGKMMSSEAIQVNGKVFFFLSRKGQAVFKLGTNFQSPKDMLGNLPAFSPFKNKAPMQNWRIAQIEDLTHWEQLAHAAYELTR